MKSTNKTYTEMLSYDSYEDRAEYARLHGQVGYDTFGFDRFLNQDFYRSKEWKRVRDIVIARDNGCDLGISDRPITGKIIIHHLNPISVSDITNHNKDILNPEYLVCVSNDTHQFIHYGVESQNGFVERSPNDTCPWR